MNTPIKSRTMIPPTTTPTITTRDNSSLDCGPVGESGLRKSSFDGGESGMRNTFGINSTQNGHFMGFMV